MTPPNILANAIAALEPFARAFERGASPSVWPLADDLRRAHAALASLRSLASAPADQDETVSHDVSLSKQAANLKSAFAEADIPWPNICINHKDAHLAELIQECLNAFEIDGGDLEHGVYIMKYLSDRIKWRMRGAENSDPEPPVLIEEG